MPFYAVANGKNIGIFSNWNDCSNSVKGYKNAKYKKFDTKEEAHNFIQTNNIIESIDHTNNLYLKEEKIIFYLKEKVYLKNLGTINTYVITP